MLSTLENGKAPGIDNIPGELIMYRGYNILYIITSLCQQIWETTEWPAQWTKSLIIPFQNEGDSRNCSDYRFTDLTNN